MALGKLTRDLALLRMRGHTTCGDQDVRSGVFLPIDLNCGLGTICECCMAMDDFYVGLEKEWHVIKIQPKQPRQLISFYFPLKTFIFGL
jgi:hypothetical protein